MSSSKRGAITEEQLAEILAVHRKTGQRLGRAAVDLGFIGEEELLKALSAQLNVPYVRLQPSEVDDEMARSIPECVARRHHLIPVKKKGEGSVVVAMADPLDERALREVELIIGRALEVVVSLEGEISACLDAVYGSAGPDRERSTDAFHKKIGEFLQEGGFITAEQLELALQRQRADGSRLGHVLVEMGTISEEDWMQALGMQLGLPYVNLATYGLSPDVVRTIPEALARHYCLLPIARQLNVLVTAMANPQDELAKVVIEAKTGYKLRPVIGSEKAIEKALDEIYGMQSQPTPRVVPPAKRIGEYLVEGGFISARELELALERQRRSDQEVPAVAEFAESYFQKIKAVMDVIPRDRVERIVSVLLEAHRQDRHIFIMGNGGSASNAAHFACDLSKTAVGTGGRRIRAMSLTENLPLLTAWSNDTHYYFGFVEQLKNLMNAGDVVIGISGSGNSQNVLNGIAYANSIGGRTVGLIGFSGGQLKDLAQESLIVPSNNMQRVEDLHLILVHLISSYLRRHIEAGERQCPGEEIPEAVPKERPRT